MVGWAISVHGGAGVDPNLPMERQEQAKQLLTRCLNLGISALRSDCPAIDVVELVVRELETDPLFNSGRGSALTEKRKVEMEASIMDGPKRRCGAVSGLTTVKNPISLARLVMDKSPHSYLAFTGAENFARQQGVELVDNDYFITEENVGMFKLAKEANTFLFDYRIPLGKETCAANLESPMHMNGLPNSVYAPETVGCVAVDSQGRCAAATSTGGLVNKMKGRIGDSPLIGAGTYACNLRGVSCTGEGDAISRRMVAREVATVVEYKGLVPQEAMDFVINERLDDGKAGLTGRIGDSPLIGAATYAGNLCGVSCTGEGKAIIRGTVAREVAAAMEYKDLGLQEAVDFVINERLDDGKAGLIAVSNKGEVACGFNCTGMFRGYAKEDGFMEVGIWGQ